VHSTRTNVDEERRKL